MRTETVAAHGNLGGNSQVYHGKVLEFFFGYSVSMTSVDLFKFIPSFAPQKHQLAPVN
jgi:hypothetical protein